MNEKEIRILVENDNERSGELGRYLCSNGAKVGYVKSSPLYIQNKVMRSKPDALILLSTSKYTQELCTLLKKTEHPPFIIIIDDIKNSKVSSQNDIDLIIDRHDKNLVDKLFENLFGSNRLVARKLNNNLTEALIAETLFKLCVTKNYCGYMFALEAIRIAGNSFSFTRCVSKDIYPEIAAKFGVSICSVERNIRTAIHSAWTRAGITIKREYFGTFAHDEKWIPTNSQFIYIIADRLTLAKQ